jgi:hypothetical protein
MSIKRRKLRKLHEEAKGLRESEVRNRGTSAEFRVLRTEKGKDRSQNSEEKPKDRTEGRRVGDRMKSRRQNERQEARIRSQSEKRTSPENKLAVGIC